jgi:hypothetical protein
MRWLGLLPAWLTLTALASSSLPLVGKGIVAASFLIALANPSEGLLFAAGLAPLGFLISAAFDISGFRLGEAIVVAFFAGSLLRSWDGSARMPGVERLPAPPRYAIRAADLFGALVVASFIGLGWRWTRTAGGLGPVLLPLARSYFTATDPLGVVEGAKLIEGLGLFAAVIVLFRRRPALAVELPVVLAASAGTAAIATLLVWRGIGPAALLQQYERMGYRVSAIVADVNAAGSYFVLVLCLAIGMALRTAGRERVAWMATAAACTFGLWWSESRTALAAAGGTIALAALWAVSRPWRTSVRISALVVLVTAVAAISFVRFGQLERDPTYLGSGLRSQFVGTSLRMIAARPIDGIGAGRYYAESPRFLSPRLAWTYGLENAHNNFLQIASETGLAGFALFGLVLAGGLFTALRGLQRSPYDWRLLGGLAGVVAFLVTCLTSHPLLVTEVLVVFWIQFGLVVVLGDSSTLSADTAPARPARPEFAFAALTVAAVLIAASIPVRAFQRPSAPAPAAAVDGFYLWETGSDGQRYRWTSEFASVFAPVDARRIEIPVRAPLGASARRSKSVEISVGGIYRGEYDVTDRWTTIPLDVTDAPASAGIKRINLKVGRGWQEEGGGTALGQLGIQVGEIRIRSAAAAPAAARRQ